jgi:hypothetical protein
LLVAWEGPTGKPVPLLVLRAGPDEREALLSIGHREQRRIGGRELFGYDWCPGSRIASAGRIGRRRPGSLRS